MNRTPLTLGLAALAGLTLDGCCAKHDGPAFCDDASDYTSEEFGEVTIAPAGDGYAVAFTRDHRAPDEPATATIQLVALGAGGATPLGAVRAAGVEVSGRAAGLAGDARGALLAWIDDAGALEVAPLAVPLGAELARPATALGQVVPEAGPISIVASTAGYLVAWHAGADDTTTLQRVTRDGARIGDPIAIAGDAMIAGRGDGYLAVWTHPQGDRDEILASAVPADAAAPGAPIALAAPTAGAAVQAVTATAAGYRVIGGAAGARWDLALDAHGAIAVPATAPPAALAAATHLVFDGAGFAYAALTYPGDHGSWAVAQVDAAGAPTATSPAVATGARPDELALATRGPGEYAAVEVRLVADDDVRHGVFATRVVRDGGALVLERHAIATDWSTAH